MDIENDTSKFTKEFKDWSELYKNYLEKNATEDEMKIYNDWLIKMDEYIKYANNNMILEKNKDSLNETGD